MFAEINWNQIFVPQISMFELINRGTLMYLGLFLMLRFVLPRQGGAMSVTDVLVVVLIADAAQNGMAGEYKTVPEGMLLVGVIVFWSFALEWLGYYVPPIGRIVHPQPLQLMKNGKLIRRNLKSELITQEEMLSQMHEQGIEKFEEVKSAFMEGDGHISFIKYDGTQSPKRMPLQEMDS